MGVGQPIPIYRKATQNSETFKAGHVMIKNRALRLTAWVQVLFLPLPSSVTLDKLHTTLFASFFSSVKWGN